MNEKPRVLFVCTHNSARSQMAEALLRHYAGDRFEACSAGLEPTDVHPLTTQVLLERGVSVDGLHAKATREFLAKVPVRFAIIVCEREEESCPRIFPFAGQTLFWGFADPAQGARDLQLAKFRRVRDEIESRIRGWLSEGP